MKVTPERIRQEVQARFNPIRGLTPDVLTQRLDAWRVGYLRDAALTFDAIERRDINLKNVSSKRKKAVARLQWDVELIEGLPEEQKAEGELHRTALKYFYENLVCTSVMEANQRGGMALLIRQMMDAVGKGYAVHEIVWKPTTDVEGMVGSDPKAGQLTTETRRAQRQAEPAPTEPAPTDEPAKAGTPSAEPRLDAFLTAEFRFVPLWFFESRTGKLRFITTAFGTEGEEMSPGDWLVTVGEAIMEACSVAYMYKTMPLKDWVNYSEKFGMPGVIGSTPAQKGSEEWNQMVEAVQSLVNDWAAVKNDADNITLLETKGGASNLPFPSLIEYMDRQIASIWRGADLSTISQGQAGVGASLQGDETDMILEDDAALISDTLNAQIDCQVIRYLFGTNRCLAYVKVGTGREEDDDVAFRREVWKGFLQDGTVNDILANLVSLKELTMQVGLPANEEYEEPYLPVKDDSGKEVTGDVRRDSEGDIVGGASQGSEDGQSTTETRRPQRSENGNNNALANESAQARDYLIRALASDLAPVRERLQRIYAISDPVIFRAKLAEFLQELPSILKDIEKDPTAARALDRIMGAAMVNGFAGNRPPYVNGRPR